MVVVIIGDCQCLRLAGNVIIIVSIVIVIIVIAIAIRFYYLLQSSIKAD